MSSRSRPPRAVVAVRLVAAALLMLLALPPASAHAPKIGGAAADHVAAANRAFQAKNYDKALEELRAGYRLAPRPEFLLTFAQIYRAAGQLQQALEACNSYLATMPNGTLAPSARQLADALRSEIDATTPAPAPPVVATPVAPPPPVVTTPPAAAPAVVSPFAPSVQASAPPPARHRKALAWGLGVGAVVVVGLAVGLGVGLGVSHERASTFGSVPFPPM
jgi:tetratricopeptide (TPR) repeat protein